MEGRERGRMGRPRQGRRRGSVSLEAMGAVTAIVVSVASLYVAVRQTSLMERQLEASVWPSLIYDTNNVGDDGKPTISFSLKNGGVGPARVRSLEVSFHGKPITGFKELLSECSPPGDHHVGGVHVGDVVGRLIPAGQTIQFLQVGQHGEEDPFFSHLDSVRFEVDGRVCFCSALDQCWTLGFHEREPARVPDCTGASKRPQYQR